MEQFINQFNKQEFKISWLYIFFNFILDQMVVLARIKIRSKISRINYLKLQQLLQIFDIEIRRGFTFLQYDTLKNLNINYFFIKAKEIISEFINKNYNLKPIQSNLEIGVQSFSYLALQSCVFNLILLGDYYNQWQRKLSMLFNRKCINKQLIQESQLQYCLKCLQNGAMQYLKINCSIRYLTQISKKYQVLNLKVTFNCYPYYFQILQSIQLVISKQRRPLNKLFEQKTLYNNYQYLQQVKKLNISITDQQSIQQILLQPKVRMLKINNIHFKAYIQKKIFGLFQFYKN
ncbi:unnamed protein product [Paramecium sonneborni]|uniref:Transmembrane protein n=1 Tax=Paramecium sonneborni TaxID=65129 RepID=A0A8S1RN12_9CILI|nr:unnamed protein product [Paramecium sonneborni]